MVTTDLALVASLLADDPVWSAYALADLQPEMTPYCRWLVHTDGATGAVALLFDGLEPPILFAKGQPSALAAALSGSKLPARVYLSVREEHAPVIACWYDHHDVRHMWRMALGGAGSEQHGAAGRLPEGYLLHRLTGADVPRVKALFKHGGPFTPDAFAAHQIELGIFYGIEDEQGELTAVGGTHIVDYKAHLAAIGNMYTRPDCRGRSFASQVLAAIVDSLQTAGIATIVLNVDHRNTSARRIYERFGFVVHCPYIEGVATARI